MQPRTIVLGKSSRLGRLRGNHRSVEHLYRRKKMLAMTIEKDSMSQALQQEQMTNSLDLMKRNLGIAPSKLLIIL
ncbi:MAG: hypothetical protein R2788_06400 [Saprospiraceae bacterium]